jgi:hypothetical protein
MKIITCRGTSAPAKSVAAPNDPVVLSGPPGAVRGLLELRNQTDEQVFIRDLALGPSKGKQSARFKALGADRLMVQARLAAGESRTQLVQLALGVQTPPGTYDATISIGGKDVPLKLIVQHIVDVELSPDSLFFVGVEPGKTHTADVLLLNRGNVPVVVPSLRHTTTLDLDFVCRTLSQAVRKHGEEGAEATLDAAFRNASRDLADWVKLSVENAGAVVEAGGSALMRISATLPDVDPQKMYEFDIRIYDEILSCLIVPEAVQAEGTETAT